MKKISFILTSLLLFNVFAFAQSNLPVKIEEFGIINSEDLEARLDVMTSISRENPDKIIKAAIYRKSTRPIGWTHRFGARVLAFAKHRGIENGKFVYENCGIEETQHISFYLVSDKNTESLCTNNEKTDFTKSFLFDSFYDADWTPKTCRSCCAVDCFDRETSMGSFNNFAKLLKKFPESKGYVSVSWEKRFLKNKSVQNKYFRQIKQLFINNGVEPSRIIFRNTEHQIKDSFAVRIVELWFIAPNGFIPK